MYRRSPSSWQEVVGMLVILVGMVVLLFSCIHKFDKECEEKGGVYLSREGKCVRGIEEVR